MEPIKINRPDIFQKIRSRLGIRTGIGRSAELDMAIHPTIDIDPLLLETRVHHYTDIDVDSVKQSLRFTVPPGEFWHCKSLSLETVALADFSLFFAVRTAKYEDTGTQSAPISSLHAFSGIDCFQVPLAFTLRPGDAIGWQSLIWVAAGGDGIMSLEFDLEDCSS